ncbi:universal stress protein [Shewanella sp. Choline-02u-19]|jgi:universal stress protein A|uniref:universal stress protein n=1 Tax=unclassified Shewanella TaxID=196818 RepID=UPI000C33F963|nr:MULTISPECIES: universal stress protein [unclassified Shewanella]PKG57026.1 universal stress protein [Shewanella sp. GutDb-MelDb]PKH54542.1 universal stress protein [Shewanella sp. Bg11-22]PKI28600.1 universal stress protein [Shewanella sp. Choline-02u-19]
MRTRQILCPTDFSETASHALKYAIEMANLYHVGLRLVHVIDQPVGLENYQILTVTPEELAQSMEESAAAKMHSLLSDLKSELSVESVIRHGVASEQILKEADVSEAGMIVIASHGRSGLAHFLHTNVAEAVANGAICPVLVVK